MRCFGAPARFHLQPLALSESRAKKLSWSTSQSLRLSEVICKEDLEAMATHLIRQCGKQELFCVALVPTHFFVMFCPELL